MEQRASRLSGRSLKLEQEIRELAPWHLEVEVAPGVTTKVEQDEDVVLLISPRAAFRDLMLNIYPEGLEGRSFLDCACNCGGYSFWAKELGASRCHGFDVREHWIRQARFLQEHRDEEDVVFELRDLYDLAGEPFDITLFKGIFYHLPDPITGLKRAADLTKELLIVNTATRNGYPEDVLVPAREDTVHPMSGVYGLNWYPAGPAVMRQILDWLGFPASRVHMYREESPPEPPELGRLEIVAARDRRVLEHYDKAVQAATHVVTS